MFTMHVRLRLMETLQQPVETEAAATGCRVLLQLSGSENRRNKAHNLRLSHLLSQDFIRILSPFFCLQAGTASWRRRLTSTVCFSAEAAFDHASICEIPTDESLQQTPGVWSHVLDESSGVWIRCEIVLISGVSHTIGYHLITVNCPAR